MSSGVVVFGYHNLGVTGIKMLLKHGIKVHTVFTHRDKVDENTWFESVSEFCRKNNISYYYGEEHNNNKITKIISKYDVSVIFSFYYRNIISNKILNIPKYGSINLHGSMLPKYRGRAPVNWQLINGETKGGVTLHCMTDKPDAGDIIDQEPVVITKKDNPLTLYSKLNIKAKLILKRNIDKIVIGKYDRFSQNHLIATYYGRRKPKDGLIDWSWDSKRILNLIRGVTKPYPGAFTYYLEKKLIVWEASKVKNSKVALGKNLGAFCNYRGRLYVKTSESLIRIDKFNYNNIDYDTLNLFDHKFQNGFFKNTKKI
jgi:UDP-4-amino-4-deoxy-L-arabinose formyltransferase / UDP-glucuronic acid dehydrogenase (UDP-4-keto-hexauronic acid decarboxylating)